MWQQIADVIALEFSDLFDVEQTTRICVRLLLAAFLGGLLGFEREQRGKAAGVKTHMLVAMGAALFVLIPLNMGSEDDAMSRVIQGVIAGVGFLCAGTILKAHDMAHVKGLTTAAGVWLTAAIGVAAGMGKEGTAVLSTALTLIILLIVPRTLDLFEPRRRLEDDELEAKPQGKTEHSDQRD
jgi:putative Mg2+ transporter-C (MgtC) family protein